MGRGLPLQGVRVLEFCWIWSGPFVGQFLADLGAEVIKIEWYSKFDPYRTRGIERLQGEIPQEVRRELSQTFHSLNRNKIGMTINLKEPDGRDLARRLAGMSDLVIDNFTAGTMARLGLGEQDLRETNPRIVTLSLSGYGQGSPLASMRAYGTVLSSISGVEAVITDDQGEFVGSPSFVVSDPNAALFGLLNAISSVIAAREQDAGTANTVSQLEAAMTLCGDMGVPPGEPAHEGVFATAEPEVYVAVRVPSAEEEDVSVWRSNFAAEAARMRQSDVVAKVAAKGGHAVPVSDLLAVPSTSVFADTECKVPSLHPATGPEELVPSPWRVNGSRAPVRKPAPMLAEGRLYVLHQLLGLSIEEIDQLNERGVA